MTPPPDVWCAIPVYNNAATIKDIATRARALLPNVLVIDDGSTDADLGHLFEANREGEAPAEPLRNADVPVGVPRRLSSTLALPGEITLLRHPTNLGKGAALLTAMHYAHDHGAKYLITLDADGQHFPEDIPRFFPHLAPDQILLGHRAEITGDMPQSSQFGREFSDFWIHLESGQTVLDSQSGFRAYPLPASLNLNVRSLRYGFEVEILTKALWSNLRCASVPIRVHYPPRAQRISSFHPLRDNTRLTLLHAKLIARQLLPLPHRRAAAFPPLPSEEGSGTGDCPQPVGGKGESRETPPVARASSPCQTTSTPLNLSLTAAITTFFSIVLYPWGFIPVLYLALRLHLSKWTAFLFLLLCLPSFISTLSQKIGHHLLSLPTHPNLERFLGSHLIAFPAALAASILVYTVARNLHPNTQA